MELHCLFIHQAPERFRALQAFVPSVRRSAEDEGISRTPVSLVFAKPFSQTGSVLLSIYKGIVKDDRNQEQLQGNARDFLILSFQKDTNWKG